MAAAEGGAPSLAVPEAGPGNDQQPDSCPERDLT